MSVDDVCPSCHQDRKTLTRSEIVPMTREQLAALTVADLGPNTLIRVSTPEEVHAGVIDGGGIYLGAWDDESIHAEVTRTVTLTSDADLFSDLIRALASELRAALSECSLNAHYYEPFVINNMVDFSYGLDIPTSSLLSAYDQAVSQDKALRSSGARILAHDPYDSIEIATDPAFFVAPDAYLALDDWIRRLNVEAFRRCIATNAPVVTGRFQLGLVRVQVKRLAATPHVLVAIASLGRKIKSREPIALHDLEHWLETQTAPVDAFHWTTIDSLFPDLWED